MNERLPYEEQLAQQLADLPLPDEERAWEDMRRRLEEEDDRIIPIWLRGCGLWGLLVVVLLGLGWWLFWYDKDAAQKEETQKVQTTVQQEMNADNTRITDAAPGEKANANRADAGSNLSDSIISSSSNQQPRNRKQPTSGNDNMSITTSGGAIGKTTGRPPDSKQQDTGIMNRKSNLIKKRQAISREDISIASAPGAKKSNAVTDHTLPDSNQIPSKKDTGIIKADSSAAVPVYTDKQDAIAKTLKDSSAKKDTIQQPGKENKQKKDSAKTKFIYFSAGVALHQQLPVNGQTLTPYNAQGRKGSLADYIPSVYFRMYKNDKWFLQGEFRYGAPQYTREILYHQKGVLDTFSNTNTITSSKLKKTFYHQLPVSFNYFILPNWSVGSGFVWNKFSAAVAEQDVVKHDIITGIDTVVSLGTVLNSRKADSNFVRSYFQAVIETQYKWKRFSIGARYSFGLQPYLKFTLPGGIQQQEKNSSFQLFLRYELWRSKKRTKRQAG
jgi:hypothetical protein